MPKGQPASGKSNAWSDTNEKRLLLLMVSGTSITKDWNKIAEGMGNSYSASACAQKFAKLKKAIEAEFGDTSNGGTGTPPKRAAASADGSAKKRGRPAKKNSNDDEDDEEELESPSKKMKEEDDGHIIVKKDEGKYDVDRQDLYSLYEV